MEDEKQPLTREFFQEQGSIGGKRGGGKGIKRAFPTKEQRSEYMRNLAAQRKNPGRKKSPATNTPDTAT